MRSASSTAAEQRFNRRSFTSSLVFVTLLAIAASCVVQGSSASVNPINAAIRQPEARNLQAIQRAADDNNSSGVDQAVSEALSLAGTSTPQASDIGGSSTTTMENAKAVAASSSVTSVASSSSATPATTTDAAGDKAGEESWSWAVGAFGCASGTASGSQGLCYATGPASDPAAADPTAMASPARRGAAIASPAPTALVRQAVEEDDGESDEDDDGFEFVRRQSDDGGDPSGNGGAPVDINNVNSPNIGWLDTVVGAVPYKNGDLAASIVWIIATLMLIPLFLIRLLRRSSLIAHVLFTIFLWGCAVIAGFGIRAYLSNSTPTTTLMIAENIILSILPNLLLEPLLSLLAMYAAQGNLKSGVPSVCLLLRFINVIALVLFSVTAAYTGVFMNQWDKALYSSVDIAERQDFPNNVPPNITRLGPIIGAFMMLASIAGGLLLIPIARGENGSMRPGGFLGVLFVLIALSVVYRILQTLHAQNQLNEEQGNGNSNPFSTVFLNNGALNSTMSLSSLFDIPDDTIVPIAAIAPAGMYSPEEQGLAWGQLQKTLSSRGEPQTPVIFNVVYIFPMWLEVFLLFFVHAPGGDDGNKLQPAAIQPTA